MTRNGARGPSSRVLVLAPHPDDEALAVGGLLQRAMRSVAGLELLFVTDGENNPWAQRVTERRWRISQADRERWRMRRRGEALASLECLGVPASRASFLAFPDQGLTDLLMGGGDDLLRVLRRTMERSRPTLLVTPDTYDLHPDHSALAVIASLARATMDPRLPRPLVLQYIVHSRRPRPRAELAFLLTAEEHRRKRAAILCHGSQLLCRRRSLLAHGDAPEEFIATGPHAAARGDHPVHAEIDEDSALVLHLAPKARLGAWGPLQLLLLIAGEGGAYGFRAHVPNRGGRAEILRWGGTCVVARAEVERAGNRTVVVLPRSLIAGSHDVFVKLERRHGFFDEAGWRALPAPAHEDGARAPAASAGARRTLRSVPAEEPGGGAIPISSVLERDRLYADLWRARSS